jgi:hypothetical protein
VAKRAHPVQRGVLVDEAWMKTWVAWGFTEMDAYLTKRAAFAAYIQAKEKVDASARRP